MKSRGTLWFYKKILSSSKWAGEDRWEPMIETVDVSRPPSLTTQGSSQWANEQKWKLCVGPTAWTQGCWSRYCCPWMSNWQQRPMLTPLSGTISFCGTGSQEQEVEAVVATLTTTSHDSLEDFILPIPSPLDCAGIKAWFPTVGHFSQGSW